MNSLFDKNEPIQPEIVIVPDESPMNLVKAVQEFVKYYYSAGMNAAVLEHKLDMLGSKADRIEKERQP